MPGDWNAAIEAAARAAFDLWGDRTAFRRQDDGWYNVGWNDAATKANGAILALRRPEPAAAAGSMSAQDHEVLVEAMARAIQNAPKSKQARAALAAAMAWAGVDAEALNSAAYSLVDWPDHMIRQEDKPTARLLRAIAPPAALEKPDAG